MEHQQNIFPQIPQTSFMERNRLLIKGFLIAFLILLMLIPAAFIEQLVRERAVRQSDVVTEVSSKWGGKQLITGPVLIVPYTYTAQGDNGKPLTIRKMAHFLPDALSISGNMEPEVRHRSIYDVTLYRSALTATGSFGPLPLAAMGIDPQQVLWNEARLIVTVADPRGLQDEVHMKWNDNSQQLEPGVPENSGFTEGLSAPVAIASGTGGSFSIDMTLRGTQDLSFSPVGRITTAHITSAWKNPASIGDYVPTSNATVSGKGFDAQWKILQPSRPYPQSWKDNANPDLHAHTFGTRLVQPADGYAKTERSVKYAILFIGLTFVVFFFIELLQKRQIHPLQYLLVGFALCVFYTLLLSISEYAGFDIAYLIAALATVLLIGLYTWSIFKSGKTAGGFTSALSALYGYIYILIRLEDNALLAGSIGLFVILAIIMYFSRRIDWYGHGKAAVA